MDLILVIVLVLLLIGVTAGFWGGPYCGGSVVGVALVIVLILWLFGGLGHARF